LCIVHFVIAAVTPVSLAMAWLYVGLRVAHSLIYLTYNHVVHRFAVFATSNLVVVAMLILLATKLPH
jgi:hypothetical protein